MRQRRASGAHSPPSASLGRKVGKGMTDGEDDAIAECMATLVRGIQRRDTELMEIGLTEMLRIVQEARERWRNAQ